MGDNMMKSTLYWFISAAVIFAACESESPLIPSSELIVVRAYLYSGEPVTDVQLSYTYDLGIDTTSGPPINDARVVLAKDEHIYELVPSAGDSGYYHYPGSDLSVEVGDIFRISIEYDEQTITATTIIPPPPENVTISSNEFVIDAESGPFGARNDTSTITVTWLNPDGSFYFILVENLEATLTPVDDRFGDFLGRFRSFRSSPRDSDNYVIRRLDVTYLGEHEVRVYKVNQEYADLFEFGQQDSRNLNEPASNIENGLGVFAGFSSDVVHFAVRTK